MTALQSHRVNKGDTRGLKLQTIAIGIGRRQQERRALVSPQDRSHSTQQGLDHLLIGERPVHNLDLQLIHRRLSQDVLKGLGLLSLGLGHRQIIADPTIEADPRAAVDDADMRGRIHGRAREVLTQVLLVPKREPNGRVGQINHIALTHDGRDDLEVLALALDLKRHTTEAARGTNLVDVLRTHDHDSQAVGVLKGCPMLING